jgi:peptidyl-tRNA hydrolase
MIKQMIVMRKDLNMRKGKMCAKATHASMAVLFKAGFSNIPNTGKAHFTLSLGGV